MEIKKVAILGAGAVGSYVIEGISGCREIRLGVIAEGERNARLKSAGCTINGVTYHPEVWTSQETDNIDLLIVSLKYGALPTALDTIKQATSQNTIVMSLMNGVDSEEIIGAKIGMSHILPALIKVASHKEPDGYHFDRKSTIGIIFGEYKSPFQSERVKAVCDLFEKSDISYRVTDYIREEIWSKFRLNVCNNLPQAILGAGVGCYRDSVHMKAISEGLRSEIEAIAAAKVVAANIDEYLGYHHEISCDVEIPEPRLSDREPCGRVELTEREACSRVCDFEGVENCMTEAEAKQESHRCLRCDHFGYGIFKGGRKEKW